MFCCGCLNTEAKLRILDENVTRAISDLLGLKIHDRYLYECICWTCYVMLMKSIKFKEQCLDVRNMLMSMDHISRESLNTLHMLNFKSKLTQSKVVLINEGPALEIKKALFCPIIEEIKSEVPDESTFTDVNETSLDVKINFTENNILSNEFVVKNREVLIEDDEIAPEKALFVTGNVLNEENVVKEDCSDSSQQKNVDITDVESGTHSGDDALLKKILEREVRIILERIDMGAPTRKRTLNEEVTQTAKLIKLDESPKNIHPLSNTVSKNLLKNTHKASDVSFSKNVSADSNLDIDKSKQIIKSAVNCDEVIKTSPKVNVLPKDKIQALDVTVQNNKTRISEVCYSNAENQILKQCHPKSVDAVDPNTSLVGYDESDKTNISSENVSEGTFSCHICHYKCIKKIQLIVHLRKHTGEKPYICDLCDFRFSQEGNLKTHVKSKHTKEKDFSCHICPYKCFTKGNLNTHLRKHTGEKPFVCDLCDYKCSDRRNLRNHIKYKHSKENNLSCPLCPYKSFSEVHLNVHLRRHTGDKPYTCDMCDYRCSAKYRLKTHIMYKHTKEKNVLCHLCPYKCFNRSTLNIHLRKHTGEKPYKCDMCDYRCTEKYYLKIHIRFKHKKEKNFSCHMCQYKCVSKAVLNAHIRKHTGERPYPCDFCDSRFSDKSNLKNHIKCKHTVERPYVCDFCDLGYCRKDRLIRHIKHKHTKEMNFRCHIAR